MQYYIHPDDESGGLATEASADREYAHNVGADNPDRAWILSNRDAWYPNPFYHGPKVPHPEEDDYDEYVYGPFRPSTYADDEIPF